LQIRPAQQPFREGAGLILVATALYINPYHCLAHPLAFRSTYRPPTPRATGRSGCCRRAARLAPERNRSRACLTLCSTVVLAAADALRNRYCSSATTSMSPSASTPLPPVAGILASRMTAATGSRDRLARPDNCAPSGPFCFSPQCERRPLRDTAFRCLGGMARVGRMLRPPGAGLRPHSVARRTGSRNAGPFPAFRSPFRVLDSSGPVTARILGALRSRGACCAR